MKTERTIKELLEVMIVEKHRLKLGLCRLSGELKCLNIITSKEEKILLDYIKNNYPINWRLIEAIITGKFKDRDYFYWKESNSLLREKWIKKHIKKLSSYSR